MMTISWSLRVELDEKMDSESGKKGLDVSGTRSFCVALIKEIVRLC